MTMADIIEFRIVVTDDQVEEVAEKISGFVKEEFPANFFIMTSVRGAAQ
jgi:nitrogen regulatory protein PII